jgi:hypothetical protein
MKSEEQTRVQGKDPGHERLSISIKGVVLAVIGLAILIAGPLLAMGPLSRLLSPRYAADEVDSFLQLSLESPQSTVGLNPNQAEDRLALEESQRQWLREYAWLDAEQQVARIPIERAMEIIREQGLLAVTKADEPSSAPAGEDAEATPASEEAEEPPPNGASPAEASAGEPVESAGPPADAGGSP